MTSPDRVPFNRSYLSGKEQTYIDQVLENIRIGQRSDFTEQCELRIREMTGCSSVLLTHSCTNALELAALLSGVGPGDEVILPSFTFTSTANAFALRGAKLVFVDVDKDSLCIDIAHVAHAITDKTRVIVPVHYAGGSCDMEALMAVAAARNILVIEDAAQAVGATSSSGVPGSLGHMGTYSFHATKNISCMEGGALLLNDPAFVDRAKVVLDKGTNRAQARAGLVAQYGWVDLGMSAPATELQAAYLLAQLDAAETITNKRLSVWHQYARAIGALATRFPLRFLQPGPYCQHNAHIFAVIFESKLARDNAQASFARAGIDTALHYMPLHSSPAGKKYGRPCGKMVNSETVPDCLLRLPIWPDMPQADIDRTITVLTDHLGSA